MRDARGTTLTCRALVWARAAHVREDLGEAGASAGHRRLLVPLVVVRHRPATEHVPHRRARPQQVRDGKLEVVSADLRAGARPSGEFFLNASSAESHAVADTPPCLLGPKSTRFLISLVFDLYFCANQIDEHVELSLVAPAELGAQRLVALSVVEHLLPETAGARAMHKLVD